MPYDAPVWAMNASLYAVRPQEGYFKVSEPGTVGVLDDGRTRFTPSAGGKHRYLISIPRRKSASSRRSRRLPAPSLYRSHSVFRANKAKAAEQKAEPEKGKDDPQKK